MHLSIIIISTLLYGLGALAADPIATWVVSNVHRYRSREDATCHWNLRIDQQQGGQVSESEVCDFEYTAPEGQACDAVSFSSIPCSQTSKFKINGGSNSMGFIVLTFVNEASNALAWFGFKNDDLDRGIDIPSQANEAYPQTRRRSVPVIRDDSQDLVANSTQWGIQDLMRAVDSQSNTINLAFSVTSADFKTAVPCRLVVDVPQGVDPQTYEWYAQRCQGSDFTASWGYTNSRDAGIMTIVSPAKDKNSFFGWNDISKNSILGDAGPNPAVPCDCR
ncbi:hypothetical protein F5B20DRAFT_576401 [Whalleya microplaca]|nr:hypothetical protein F5B20DRAFT_576401 [Whalleya microplaca]